MRRAPIVLAATIAGTTGVLAVHPQSAAVKTASAASPASSKAITASARSSPKGTTASTSGTATGSAVDTRYGPVQVRVTVKAGKIVSVDGLELTGNDPRSAQISASAAPTLRQEALTRQSAGIDAVSGATYTSAGYAQSLQSALDKVGYKAPDGSVATLQVPA